MEPATRDRWAGLVERSSPGLGTRVRRSPNPGDVVGPMLSAGTAAGQSPASLLGGPGCSQLPGPVALVSQLLPEWQRLNKTRPFSPGHEWGGTHFGGASAPREGKNSPQKGSVRESQHKAAGRGGVGGSLMHHLPRGATDSINPPVTAGCPLQGAGDTLLHGEPQASPTRSFNTLTGSLVPAASSPVPADFGHRRPFY